MNTKLWFKSAFSLTLGVLLALGIASCSPDAPENEINHKLHEDPFKAVLTLQEGKLIGGKFNANPEMKHFEASPAVEQKVVWETQKGKGWTITSPAKSFKVKNIEQNPDVVYCLKFEYFNLKGEPMNYQFFDNGQDKIHQHFFSVYKPVTLPDGSKGNIRETKKENLPFDYNYADEYNGNYIAATNPMGFQGFIRFVQPATNFDLTIELLHSAKSKLEDDGTPSPFYLPSRTNRSTGLWDINITIPIEIE